MPILHNRAHKVLKQIIELQEDLADLCLNVEESIRRSARRAVFGANTPVEFDYESVKDQIPAFWRRNRITKGIVVAVDYRTEKVTVNCGSLRNEHTGETTIFEFVLDIQDVWVAKDYESERDDEPNFDRGYNSDA